MIRRSLFSIVDDDVSVRESLPDLLKEFGFAVDTFSSGEEFLASDSVLHTNCLILDIAMPFQKGLDSLPWRVLRAVTGNQGGRSSRLVVPRPAGRNDDDHGRRCVNSLRC